MSTGKPKRTCGGCTLCCYTHQVPNADGTEFKKDFVDCIHCVKGVGCNIYEKGRPGSCVDMTCAWIEGLGDESERPDKTGVVAQFRGTGNERFLTLSLENSALLENDYVRRITRDHVAKGFIVTIEDSAGHEEVVVKSRKQEKRIRSVLRKDPTVKKYSAIKITVLAL